MTSATATEFDLLIIGGGINGTGIARDAAGRGLSVMLVEQGDLAGHTSSASTKLIHGGLRYLEYGEFRLVREALIERERLLAIAPHIIRPQSFILPQMNGVRPAWMIRLGLFIYDHLGGRKLLPPTRTIRSLASSPEGQGMRSPRGKAFEYWDCWVDDSRLVVLNARDAANRGAKICVHTRLLDAWREEGRWNATLASGGQTQQVVAKSIVNAAGPWVAEVLNGRVGLNTNRRVRLVKGSHIVLPRLFEGDHAFILQNDDRRIVFAIPYERDYTLVGTTDLPWSKEPGTAHISDEETAYLLAVVNRYFDRPMGEGDIVWSYAGIRPLYDDKASNASAVTRDYMLDLNGGANLAPILSIFGGKITTYRKLAEHALEKLAPFIGGEMSAWTAQQPLPGGDIPASDRAAFIARECEARPNLPEQLVERLVCSYGTLLSQIIGDASTLEELGRSFSADLYQREVDYLISHEWARSSQDILVRRSKLGLRMRPPQIAELDAYIEQQVNRAALS